MSETIFTVIILILIFFSMYGSIRLVLRLTKFLGNFTVEVLDYLDEQELKLIEIRKPEFDDWKTNPFKKKDSYLIENMFPFTTLKHKIIIASNRKNKVKVFWLQSKLKLLKKSTTDFIPSNSKKYIKLIEEKYIIVTDKCPGCHAKVKPIDIKCSNCGLNFD